MSLAARGVSPAVAITVDVGNTSIGVGRWDGERVEVQRVRAPDDAAPLVTGPAWVVAVSPPRLAALGAAVQRAGGGPLQRLERAPLPVVDARLAATAGADRLAAVLAALPGPAVVADCGTAVTVDLVDAAGVFLGGFIAPGLGAALDGLAAAAPALPRVAPGAVPLEPAVETVGAMRAGAWGLVAGGVDRLVAAALERLGPRARVVATGGWGEAWAAASRHASVEYDEVLVHRGIRLWAAHEAGRASA